MLKAVIFDDEYIVLQGLQRMIDWSKYGIELVGTASNGFAAIDLVETHSPDIVFTDIRMPGMDGLQVVEKILAAAPEIICIVFSGFNEFDYVKKAIKLGVSDYLEKPITIPMMEETLKKIQEKVQQHKSVLSLEEKWENSRIELIEKATLGLLLEGVEAFPKWRNSFGEGSKDIVGVTVLALSEKIQELPNDSSYLPFYVRNGAEHLLVIFHYHEDTTELWKQLLYWPGENGISVGSGRTYQNLTDAPKGYKEALQALRYGHFLEQGGWTRFEEIGENPNIPGDLSELEESIIFYLRTGDKTGLFKQLSEFISKIQSQRLNPDLIEREILKLIYLGMEVAKETGEDISKISQGNYLPHIEIRMLNTKEKMFNWLKNQMEMIMDWFLFIRRDKKHEAVEKACVYIQKNFSKDLTLQDVAEYVGMNPTYFSLLFKEEMKISYIKYLTKFRIERAKELLQEGYKVADVSEKVGYHTYRHFSELFKKQVGVNPGQYRDSF
ncbi:response regulator [Neobacillus sp. 179-C4.2 HS]|uniref:Response regulator n=1 Tax=Neobacillus driksii TaxID=3035913 RepID=A0ABV4YUS1_9BACI|nr:response regulator [Neobacillus sp. 179.-C4.2 HS]MDP5192968.1 response regulator [Neobacillus sp. 179.-C4.2 HS]